MSESYWHQQREEEERQRRKAEEQRRQEEQRRWEEDRQREAEQRRRKAEEERRQQEEARSRDDYWRRRQQDEEQRRKEEQQRRNAEEEKLRRKNAEEEGLRRYPVVGSDRPQHYEQTTSQQNVYPVPYAPRYVEQPSLFKTIAACISTALSWVIYLILNLTILALCLVAVLIYLAAVEGQMRQKATNQNDDSNYPLAPERIDPIAREAMKELKKKLPKYDEVLVSDLVEDWQETGDVPDLFKSFWRGKWLELYPSDRPSGIDPAFLDEIDTEGYRAMTRLFQNGYLNEAPQPQ